MPNFRQTFCQIDEKWCDFSQTFRQVDEKCWIFVRLIVTLTKSVAISVRLSVKLTKILVEDFSSDWRKVLHFRQTFRHVDKKCCNFRHNFSHNFRNYNWNLLISYPFNGVGKNHNDRGFIEYRLRPLMKKLWVILHNFGDYYRNVLWQAF